MSKIAEGQKITRAKSTAFITPSQLTYFLFFDFSLQPQNILLTKGRPTFGDIKLIDFGIARWLHKEEEVRDIVGTPDYVGKMCD